MARGRKGRPVHGWLVLDKPLGLSSTQALAKARRLLQAAKAGHGGTLDPLATGVLPIAFGEATKTIPFVMDSMKSYRFTVAWGEERSTDDLEGDIVETSDRRPTMARIRAVMPDFIGAITQTPPRYSAIRIGGQRAYDLARQGMEVAPKPRQVVIHRFDLLGEDHDRTVCASNFEIDCGKGTYVRAIARDLGRKLGVFGHVTALRRCRVGPFDLRGAISLDKLAAMVHSPPPNSILLPVETALDDIPALAVTGGEAKLLRLGQMVRAPSRKSGTVRVMTETGPVALADLQDGELRPFRVFNL
ncbi:MAG: tRNA pseudouridine(55) synthase TruB [Sphingomonadales bacterium]